MGQQVCTASKLNLKRVGIGKPSLKRATFVVQDAKPSELIVLKLNLRGRTEPVSVATGSEEVR
jgi:hypothetical protein